MKNVMYYSDKLQRGEPVETVLVYKITGAGTFTQHDGNASLVSNAAITDAAVAAFLNETTTPFTADAFDATAMGTGVFGGVVDFAGQVKELLGFSAEVIHATASNFVKTGIQKCSSMTASTAATECDAVNGNVAFRAVLTGLDALTAGLIVVKIWWRPE